MTVVKKLNSVWLRTTLLRLCMTPPGAADLATRGVGLPRQGHP
jgi:hypothetical protein